MNKRFQNLGGHLIGTALLLSLAGGSPAQAQTKSPKRGLAYGNNSAADMQVLAPGISWWYNWYSKPEAGAASVYPGLAVDYVPMQWGRLLDGVPFSASQLAANIPAGAKYLLGFNEPNFTSQSNLTPSQAAALWPTLQDVARQKNLKLVSPAVNYCGSCVSENGVTYSSPTQYLDAFFAACPSCQVDYIAVHTYVCQEQYLRDKIAELKKYNKPIWLTEFACGDMPAANITLDVQKKYLTDAVNYLENEPAVFRYSWFSGRNAEIPNINLLGSSGQLTDLGRIYVGLPAGSSGTSTVTARLTPVGATASSSQNSGTLPGNAIDGSLSTRWGSAFTTTEYLQLDLGAAKDISRVKINWEGAYAKDYKLETSLDGSAWTPLQTVLNGDGGIDDITGLTGRGRYLRLTGTRRALTAYGYSVYELEVYGPTTTTTSSVIVRMEAENYSNMQGVQVQATTDTGGGQNVSAIDAGDWMIYNNVKFPTAGAYTIEYRVASPNGSTVSADFNAGGIQLGSVTIPATGGFQNWTTVTQTINVATAGTYNLGIFAKTGGWSFNWLRISKAGSARGALATTATTMAEASELEVYPNPVTDRLQIRSAHSLAGSRFRIVDVLGRAMASGAAAAGSVDVSALKPGVYTLVLTAEGEAPRATRFQK